MTRQLWAPWRLEYIRSGGGGDCVFCSAVTAADEGALVVNRGAAALVLLNRFPYSPGHLLVAPFRHVGGIGELDDAEVLEIHRLAEQGMAALATALAPEGHNLGWNLGKVAGGSIVDHVHLHVVPRWTGDTNFMPVLADVKVLPEHLDETRRKLAAAWPHEPPG